MKPDQDFPRLTPEHHRATSPAAIEYNCVAWAAGDTQNWCQPGVYWPETTLPDEFGIGILEDAFKALGYELCDNDRLEPGFEKVALYGNNIVDTHAARQLSDGKWTSKLGKSEDIEHDNPDVVAGALYTQRVTE